MVGIHIIHSTLCHQIQVMKAFITNSIVSKTVFIALAVLALSGIISAPVALLAGFVFAQLFTHPFLAHNHKITGFLLKASVVGLGFGMNMGVVLKTSKEGLGLTVFSILFILIAGTLLGAALKLNKQTTQLVSAGTAICGGSAIAAIAPVINASEKSISVSLGIVFFLNACALFVFPAIGHSLHLTQEQFGLWSAIAIHDTSSVVGAASSYGNQALEIATIVKLTRALWIIPVSLIMSFVFKQKGKPIAVPWFIGLFILAGLLNTYWPEIQTLGSHLFVASKRGLTLSLLLIGSGLSIQQVKEVGWKPFVLGISLWVAIAILSLVIILHTS